MRSLNPFAQFIRRRRVTAIKRVRSIFGILPVLFVAVRQMPRVPHGRKKDSKESIGCVASLAQ